MDDNKVKGYQESVKLVHQYMSPRAERLAELERWVSGTQYDGRPDWFSDRPLPEKAPCIVEPIVSDAIDSHVDMVLGEGKFPAVTARPGEDEADDAGGLNEADSANVDKLVAGATEQARFRALCREALGMAMGCSSSCAIYGVRDGKLFGDTVKSRWCEPEFGPDGRTVRKLVIEYPYIDVYRDGREWRARAMVYRREIDDTQDVTMKPVPADVVTPNWVGDSKQTFMHGLGKCPVIWYPFMKGCSIEGEYDGHAPHATLTDEIYAHDVALSMRHRSVLYCGDPQWTECGVDLGSNPSQSGEVVPTLATLKGGEPSGDNPVTGSFRGAEGPKKGRKKHPGVVWQYEDKDTVVELHQLNGDALKAIGDHASDLRVKIMQALAYVPLDAESSQVIRGQLSGKALESLMMRQLNRDDRIRDDFGDGFILPSVQMLLHICNVKRKELKVRGLQSIKKAITVAPSLSLRWGSYTKLDGAEQAQIITAAMAARAGGAATLEMTVGLLAPIYKIENIKAACDAIEKESEKNAQKAVTQAQNMQAVTAKNPDTNQPAPTDEKK